MHFLHSEIFSSFERNGSIQGLHWSGHIFMFISRRNGQSWHLGSYLNRNTQESPSICDATIHWTVLVTARKYLLCTLMPKSGKPIAPPQSTASITRANDFIGVSIGVSSGTKRCPFIVILAMIWLDNGILLHKQFRHAHHGYVKTVRIQFCKKMCVTQRNIINR